MPKLERFPDWQDRLTTYLDRCRDEPFYWGKHDCALFAAGAVKAITGVDVAKGVSGSYLSKLEAAEYLRKTKRKTLHGAATKALGKSVHIAQAGLGDIVRWDKALGVCVGKFSWFVGEINGVDQLVSNPTLQCSAAWKVG